MTNELIQVILSLGVLPVALWVFYDSWRIHARHPEPNTEHGLVIATGLLCLSLLFLGIALIRDVNEHEALVTMSRGVYFVMLIYIVIRHPDPK